MIMLLIIGVVLTLIAWNVNTVLGVVVGALSFAWIFARARTAYGAQGKEFISAWESQLGEMRRGDRSSQPPPGAFQHWVQDNKATGISASEWIRQRQI